jgi:hypothetical protein
MIKAKEKFTIASLDDLSELDEALDKIEPKLKEGVEYTIYVLDSKKNRTLNANRYYHGVVLKTIAEEMGTKNLDITAEDLHEVLKGKFNSKVVIVDGTPYEIGASTKKMSQDDFVNYIEEIREWSLDTLKCWIPLPSEVVESSFGNLYIQSYHEHK